MHATWWWPWDGMRRKHEYLEPMCDVQGMSVTTAETETDYEDCNNYAHAHVFPKCFKSLHKLLGFVSCFVLTPRFVPSMMFLSLWSYTQSVSQILAYFTSRKRVFWGVVFTDPVGYRRPPSAVNDTCVIKQNEFVKAIRLRFLAKICKQQVAPFDRKPLHASSFFWLSLNS